MKLNIKPGTVFSEINDAYLSIFDAVFRAGSPSNYTPTITSANDGKHMKGSKHYVNAALDIRTMDMKRELWEPFAASIRTILGKDYDVIVEKDHIHIEHDPKPNGTSTTTV